MALNEKIRSEDVIEIIDSKVLTNQPHASLGVIARENYDSVLTKIDLQTLTPAQKAAFDATLTVPSALNPVVLKDDLQVYIPQADLGEVKDSVAVFGDLPVPTVVTGDIEIGSGTILNLSSTINVVTGQEITGTGIPVSAFVLIVTGTSLTFTGTATATTIGETLNFDPTLGDLRAVIADGVIYRWTGTLWDPFISNGTLDHTELNNQNADVSFQHLTTAEKTALLAATHTHANKAILDLITLAGSGIIITAAERLNLPTADQKDALLGTAGIPSAANLYVTNQDPRLITVRNPYVTIGPPGSLATFEGVDYSPFNDALSAITVGTALAVKAIESLPGTFAIGGVVLKWEFQPQALLIEAFVPGSATLQFQGFQAGIQALLPGTGQVTIRGFIFELNDIGTSGFLTERENTLIEDCTFKPGPSTSIQQEGVILKGNNSVVRRCSFLNELEVGVRIEADSCRVEECLFSLTTPADSAIRVVAGVSGSIIDHCQIISGTIEVQTTAALTQISGNQFGVNGSISDLGNVTRILENQPQSINQPFLGAIRTIGPANSYADYTGNDETPFVSALADPLVRDLIVIAGSYTFAGPVAVPIGKTITGSSGDPTTVNISGTTTLFTLGSRTRVRNLTFTSSNASLITATSSSEAAILNCIFNLTAVSASTQFAVSISATNDSFIGDNIFAGIRGVHADASLRLRLHNNLFSNSGLETEMDAACIEAHILDNYFNCAVAPDFRGDRLIIEGNHFLGTLPTKIGTADSVWQGNYPHPSANNDSGADTVTFSSTPFLEPVTGAGILRSILADTGTIAFGQTGTAIAVTTPIPILALVNKGLGYVLNLDWSAPLGSTGAVVWRLTATFRDSVNGLIGTSIAQALVSTRTGATENDEDNVQFTFTNLQYGIGTNPTHVSIIVERVNTDVSDTLADEAHLLEFRLTLPRD